MKQFLGPIPFWRGISRALTILILVSLVFQFVLTIRKQQSPDVFAEVVRMGLVALVAMSNRDDKDKKESDA